MYSARMTGIHFPPFISVSEQQELRYLQEFNSNEVDCEYFYGTDQNSSDISYLQTETNEYVYNDNQQQLSAPATSTFFINDSSRRGETCFSDSGIPKPALHFSATFESVERQRKVQKPTDQSLRIANADNKIIKKSKLNHSMIEKRRRDKMKNYLQELASLVPMCRAIESNKLDKFTVLKLAMQHIKSSRLSSIHQKKKFVYEENRNREAIAERADNNNIQTMNLLLKSTSSFTAVISCQEGIFYFLSPSVLRILRVAESEAVGKSIFDFIHKGDVDRVKSALNYNSSNWGLQKGIKHAETSYRTFICRLRLGEVTECEVSELQSAKIKTHETTKIAKKRMSKRRLNREMKESYVEFICSGVVRWEPSAFIVPAHLPKHNKQPNVFCFVCVFRKLDDRKSILSSNSLVHFNIQSRDDIAANEHIDCERVKTPQIMRLGFLMRLDKTGNVLFASKEVFEVMGVMAEVLKGTSFYQYVHSDDIFSLMESHKSAMNSPQGVVSAIYRVRSPDGFYIHLQSTCHGIKDITAERNLLYIIYINKVVPDHHSLSQTHVVDGSRQNQLQFLSQNTNVPRCHNNLKPIVDVAALSKTADDIPRSPIISEISLNDGSPLTELLNGVTENSEMLEQGSAFLESALAPEQKNFENYETNWTDVFTPDISRNSSWMDYQEHAFTECDDSTVGLNLFNDSDLESNRDLQILEHPLSCAKSRNIYSTITEKRTGSEIREKEDLCTASQLLNKNYDDVGKTLPRKNISYFPELLNCYAKDYSLTDNASNSSLPLHQLIDNLTNID